MTAYLSGQVLLHIVPGNKDPAFEASTLQLQVLPLSPEQVGLLLRLVDQTSVSSAPVCTYLLRDCE